MEWPQFVFVIQHTEDGHGDSADGDGDKLDCTFIQAVEQRSGSGGLNEIRFQQRDCAEEWQQETGEHSQAAREWDG